VEWKPCLTADDALRPLQAPDIGGRAVQDGCAMRSEAVRASVGSVSQYSGAALPTT
jgi:hypothetical protein